MQVLVLAISMLLVGGSFGFIMGTVYAAREVKGRKSRSEARPPRVTRSKHPYEVASRESDGEAG